MIAYIIRRLMYVLPILVGVNILTFALFFVVNTPDDMAHMQLGMKHVTEEAVDNWKAERGYDRPLFYNGEQAGLTTLTDTIFLTIQCGCLFLILVSQMMVGILATIFQSGCGPHWHWRFRR